ncbi:MAG: hypothetical protein HEQ39_05670 [Rhizobacter sp.]
MLARGYNAFKHLFSAYPGFDALVRGNKNEPTSPASQDVLRWALQGIEDGQADRRRFQR